MKGKLSVLFLSFMLSFVFVSAVLITVYPMAIDVNVMFEDGSAVSGVDVDVFCDGEVVSGVSDVDGSFVAGFVSESCVYVVEGMIAGFSGIASSVCEDSSDVGAMSGGDIIVGRVACHVDLVLVEVKEEIVVFSGVVYNESLVVEGASVNVSCDGVLESGLSDVNGSYYFEFLSLECSASYEVNGSSGSYFDGSGVLDVGADNVYDLYLVKDEEPVEVVVFSGVVYNESLGVDGASVNVSCDGVLRSVLSGVDGNYSVEFLEEECNDLFRVDAEKDGYEGSSGELNVSDGTVVDVYLEEVEEVEEVEEDVVLVFSGVVYNGSLIVVGANVSLTCGDVFLENVSDVNGSYYFEANASECEGVVYFVDAVSGDYEGSSGELNVSLEVENVYDLDVVFVEDEEEDDDSGSSGGSSGGSSSSGGGWAGCSEGYHVDITNGTKCVADVVQEVNVSELEVSEVDFVEEQQSEEPGLLTRMLALITGAVIGGGIGNWIAALIFALVVLGLFLIVRKKLRDNKK